MSYIKREKAENAIAKYLRKQDVKRYGSPRLANSEYMFVAIDILRDVPDEGEDIPSAQPDIIRCKDCKYHDENWRRVSVRWLPCMDVRTGSNWYCGSAERRTDE